MVTSALLGTTAAWGAVAAQAPETTAAPEASPAAGTMAAAGTTAAPEASAAAEPGSSPAATPSPRARSGLEDELPSNLGGFDTVVDVRQGADALADLDPADPASAARAARLQGLFDATGVTVDDMSSGFALVAQEDFFAFVVALRLDGATPGTILPAYLPILTADLVDPETSAATMGGKDVLVITSQTDDGSRIPLYVYATDDTVWIVQGPDDVVSNALEDLPSSG